jgi:hypothetical protein
VRVQVARVVGQARQLDPVKLRRPRAARLAPSSLAAATAALALAPPAILRVEAQRLEERAGVADVPWTRQKSN